MSNAPERDTEGTAEVKKDCGSGKMQLPLQQVQSQADSRGLCLVCSVLSWAYIWLACAMFKF